MFKNYLKTTLRNLTRRRGYAAINIVGLALGIACCLLIGLYVQHERSYDRHHADAERIYRVVQQTENGGMAWTGGAMAPALSQDVPEVEAVARLIRQTQVVRYREPAAGVDRFFEEEGFVYADPSVFEVFTLPFVEGDPSAALAEPRTLVLTRSAAERYFGADPALGKLLYIDGQEQPSRVTGVIEDVPETSHLDFDVLTSVATFKVEQWGTAEPAFGSFWWPFGYTYVKLRPGATAARVNAKLPDFIAQHREAAEAARYVPQLQAVTDIHLHSDLGSEWQAGGDITYVYLFSAIALFVLLIACVNFMNLATARSAERAKEVGVRKVMGAHRSQLVRQFFGESLVLSGAALVVALGLVQLALPFFNELAGRTLAVDYAGNGLFWLGVAGVVLATGLLAGSYPALYLSRFRPAVVLKGGARAGGGAARLRKGLVLFQFAICIALVAATLIAVRQLGFLQGANLGFDQEHVVAVELKDGLTETLVEQLARDPNVVATAYAQRRPGLGTSSNPQVEEPPFTPPEQLDGEGERVEVQYVGFGFFEAMGVDLVAGRTFSEAYGTDPGRQADRPENSGGTAFDDRAFVVNQAFLSERGWTADDALGRELRLLTYENGRTYMDHRGRIVGVVQDYHVRSLHETIPPVVFGTTQFGDVYQMANYLLVRVRPDRAASTMASLQAAWAGVLPDVPFEASFLDQDLENRYLAEQRLSTIIGLFGFLAVLIACLGLFGLAAFTAAQRTKEIGVRKVMGASVGSLVALLSRDFVGLVGLAAVVGGPLAYLAMERWLDTFAYRVDVGAEIFVVTGLGALAIALATVSGQAVRAARRNPVDSLRHE